MNTSTTAPYVISPGILDHGEPPPPLQILKPDGSFEPTLEPALDHEQLLAMYRALVLTRELDTRLLNLQRQGRIGFYVPCTGEEAAQVGSSLALDPGDWCFSQYREPGSALIRGMPLLRLICQMYGNAQDPLKGRQMPSHFGWRDAKFVPASSPVGTQIPMAVGAAMASKIKKEQSVTLVYFGEGATSQGDFHVACNMAGVSKTPIVFFCKNNRYAISMHVSHQTASETIAQKAIAYGFDGVRVDGNDTLAVYKVTRDAAKKAREGYGPTLIEAVTYRIGPHSTADDPTRYRDDAEVQEAVRKDPVERFKQYLLRKSSESNGAAGSIGWTEERDKDMRSEIAKEVDQAIRAAEEMEKPQIETIFEDVYAEMPWHLKEQLERARVDQARAHSEHPTWGKEDDSYKFP